MSSLAARVVGPDEVDGLDAAWEDLLSHSRFDDVFAGSGYARAWRRTLGRDASHHVVVVEDGTELRLVASLAATADAPDAWQVAGTRRADYTNVVHAAGDLAAVHTLTGFLARRGSGCRQLSLRNVPGDADVLAAFPLAVVEGGWRQRVPALLDRPIVTRITKAEHPSIDRAGLAEQRDQLTASKNSAYQVRLLGRTGPVAYRTTTDPAEVAAGLPEFFALHRLGSHGQGRPSPFEDPAEEAFAAALVEDLSPRRAVRLDLLHAGDHLVAAHLGFEWRDRVLWYKPCFDPDHAKASPGKLLLLHAIADAHDRGFEELDLLKGTEGYKDRFATQVRTTGGLDLFSTRRAWLAHRRDG